VQRIEEDPQSSFVSNVEEGMNKVMSSTSVFHGYDGMISGYLK